MKKKFIFITTQGEGFHKYEGAPEEVAFLRNLHRHLFHIRCTIEVYHNDRELEFIMVKREVEKYINEQNLFSASCESIAERLYNWIKQMYGDRCVVVEVNEDNENGAIVGDYL